MDENMYIVFCKEFDEHANMYQSNALACFRTKNAAKKYCEAVLLLDSVNYGAKTENTGDEYYEVRWQDGSVDAYYVKPVAIH